MSKPGQIQALADRIANSKGLVGLVDAERARVALGELITCRAANEKLLSALKSAQAHLEWIGWGDSYERSCARESRLEEQINEAIAKAEGKT
jgi:hypothetical protein